MHYKLNSSNGINENCGLFFYGNQLKILKKIEYLICKTRAYVTVTVTVTLC